MVDAAFGRAGRSVRIGEPVPDLFERNFADAVRGHAEPFEYRIGVAISELEFQSAVRRKGDPHRDLGCAGAMMGRDEPPPEVDFLAIGRATLKKREWRYG